MGNCCSFLVVVVSEDVKLFNFLGYDYGCKEKFSVCNNKKVIMVLSDVEKENIEEKYLVDSEFGCGEFGVIYLCIDWDMSEFLVCKLILKSKLWMVVDVDDVSSEVVMMKYLFKNLSIVSLKEVCEDENVVYLVMELCEGGELFDSIVVWGYYMEWVVVVVISMIMEVV